MFHEKGYTSTNFFKNIFSDSVSSVIPVIASPDPQGSHSWA
jgi:hypothetical protein